MASLIIDRISHAFLAHHLAGIGRDIGELPDIVGTTFTAEADRRGVSTETNLSISNRRDTSSPQYRLLSFIDGDGNEVDLPDIAMTVKLDLDGDLVAVVREIAISPIVRLRRRQARSPYEVILLNRLPEAVLDGLGGRMLRDVVSHPAIDQLDIAIDRASRLPEHEFLIIPNGIGNEDISVLTLRPFGKTIIR